MTSQRESFAFNIPAGGFDTLTVDVQETEGFWIFEIHVEQKRNVLDDIAAYVLDHDNYLVWKTKQATLGTRTAVAPGPQVIMLTSAKFNWGTLSFQPLSQGRHYLVLDNSHSSITPKAVLVLAYWVSQESTARKVVREALRSLAWPATWRLFEEAEKSLLEKRLAGACQYLRIAISTLWKQVAEKNSGQAVAFEPGKSTDVRVLQKSMEAYVPSYILSTVRQSWSLASELAHAERRDGQEPPLDQVILAHRLVYASAAFLVTLLRR